MAISQSETMIRKMKCDACGMTYELKFEDGKYVGPELPGLEKWLVVLNAAKQQTDYCNSGCLMKAGEQGLAEVKTAPKINVATDADANAAIKGAELISRLRG